MKLLSRRRGRALYELQPSARTRHLPYRFISLAAAVLLVFSTYILLILPKASATTQTFTTSGTWNVPSGVTSAKFEAWGGGGGGGGCSATHVKSDAGGGAGGQYAIKTLSGLVFNDAYTVTVGTGGGSDTAGNDSKVTSPTSATVSLAKGGAPGSACGTNTGGTGSATGGIGDTVNRGGSGGTGVAGSATGAGGGGAGSTGAGGDASGATAGTGTSLNGGNGCAGVTANGSNGCTGSNYGGGGSGASAQNGTFSGGSGAPGLVTITYNTAPAAPTLSTPSSGATGVSTTPTFTLSTTDPDSDYVDYEVQVCSNSSCSTVVYTACEVSGLPNICSATSQTGWSGQDANSGLAYATTPSSGTTATYTYQGSALTPNTQYWWRAYAIDPTPGSNTASSASTIQSFTTTASGPTTDQCLRGCEWFNSGAKQPFNWAQ